MNKISIVCEVSLCNITLCVLHVLNNTRTDDKMFDFMLHHGGRGGVAFSRNTNFRFRVRLLISVNLIHCTDHILIPTLSL